MAYTLDQGGGAFYAPKIDIFIDDALGREWQMATIQADYQLPQRFDLEYRAADGGFERPVVIHYAIYGSFERFIGIITEEYAGAFPLWLAPVQVDGRADRRPPPRLRRVGPRGADRCRPSRRGRRPIRADAGRSCARHRSRRCR